MFAEFLSEFAYKIGENLSATVWGHIFRAPLNQIIVKIFTSEEALSKTVFLNFLFALVRFVAFGGGGEI